MSRRIIWYEYEAGGSESKVDGYFDRVLKYIPADVVGLWLTGSGLIQSQGEEIPKDGLLWLWFIVGLVLSFFWTRKQTQEAGKRIAWQQIWLSSGSYIVWVFAIGGPFVNLSFYKPFYGSLLLIFYTSIVPLLPAPESEK
ncbi:MAG: hypothetical protein AAFO04_27760 [Cyanobacteria bacterium J06592_8]